MARKPNTVETQLASYATASEGMLRSFVDTRAAIAGIYSDQLALLMDKASAWPKRMSEDVYKEHVYAVLKREAEEGALSNQSVTGYVSVCAGVVLGVSHGIARDVGDTKAQTYATRVRSLLKDNGTLSETAEQRATRKANEAAKAKGEKVRAEGAGRKADPAKAKGALEAAAMLLCANNKLAAKAALTVLTTTDGRKAFLSWYKDEFAAEEPQPTNADSDDMASAIAAAVAAALRGRK
jgi:hypothetical protein